MMTTPELEQKLKKYAELLAAENQAARLTGPREPDVIYRMLVIDCLRALPFFKGKERFVDVGTGGGIPGLVIAAALPETSAVLIDSIDKKIRAVARMADALGLHNVTALRSRSEDLAERERESFDAAISRAVSSAPVIAEYMSPLVRKGGQILAFKGPGVRSEILPADGAWGRLGLSPPEIVDYEHDEKQLTIIRWLKVKKCPKKYPRRPGEAERKMWCSAGEDKKTAPL